MNERCINNCGGWAARCYWPPQNELRDGKLLEYRPEGRKLFCEFCAPEEATPSAVTGEFNMQSEGDGR